MSLALPIYDSTTNALVARKREILSAAAASGISVAFGSPIGGVLFSLEQLSYYFPDKTMWQSFVCAMTAAVVLQSFDPFRSGKLVLYQVQFKNSWQGFEIVPFMLLGVLGGVYGGLFIRANMRVARWKKATPRLPGPLTQVFLVALLTALINYPNFYMRAQTSELVSSLFSDCALVLDDQFGLCKTGAATAGTIALLLLAALLGFVLASLTFGLHIPAGIILPSMAIGALSGRALGIVMEIWQRNQPDFFLFGRCAEENATAACVTPGVYAIVGAAATLAGVTRMTVSIVVIMFELTGALTYVLPIMIAVMFSKWVGDALTRRRGIYEAWIHHQGYPFLDAASSEVGGGGALADATVAATAAQVMTRVEDLVVLTAAGHTIASLRRVLASCDYRGFPVVADARDAALLGYISRAELAWNLDAAERGARRLPPETEVFFCSTTAATTAVGTLASHHRHTSSVSRRRPEAEAEGVDLGTTGAATSGFDAGAGAGVSDDAPAQTLDLRPWMDRTPLTLPSRASLHLAVSYFQKLGVRYVLFVDRGALQGLLTKKDCWYILEGAEETRRAAAEAGIDIDAGGAADVGPHRGLGVGVRDVGSGAGGSGEEDRGLLAHDDDTIDSPATVASTDEYGRGRLL